MDNLCGEIPSKESASSSSPIMSVTPSQPENASVPSDHVGGSDIRDQSQSPADSIPCVEVLQEGDDFEMTEDGKKRKIISVVWNHFKKKTINGEEKAICNYCNKQMTGRRSDGTNHLRRHYQTCKRRPYRDIRQALLVKEQKKADGSSSFL
ncbi:Zinc finger, BED-type, partial [Sesbania bispinosa]